MAKVGRIKVTPGDTIGVEGTEERFVVPSGVYEIYIEVTGLSRGASSESLSFAVGGGGGASSSRESVSFSAGGGGQSGGRYRK